MFTGIVEEVGCVRRIEARAGIVRIELLADKIFSGTRVGDSIAVNGVCLTVTDLKEKSLFFDIMAQTLSVTTLKNLKPNDRVNCERALKVGDRVGGHFVTGHIDCQGVLRLKKRSRGNWEFQIAIAPRFLKFVYKRGSIALDGISLTIADIKQGAVVVDLIPHTLESTTWADKKTGNKVNVEFDILAKKGSVDI